MLHFTQTIFKSLIFILALQLFGVPDAGLFAPGLFATGFFTTGVFAEGAVTTGPASDRLDDYENKAADIHRKIGKKQKEIKRFSKSETDAIKGLRALDRSLDTTRKHCTALKKEMEIIEQQIMESTAAYEALKSKIADEESYAAKRAVALYKLQWLGKLHVFAAADSMHTLLQSKKYLENIINYDKEMLEDLAQKQDQMQEALAALNTRKLEKKTLDASYRDEMQVLSEKRTQKSRILTSIRKKKSLALAAKESLKKEALNLDQKIKDCLKARKQAAIESVSVPVSVPASGDSQNLSVENKFPGLKGLLKMPVQGKIIYFFGQNRDDELDVSNFKSGIGIRADRGEPVHAVAGGLVLYADWLKGYGNLIIIDHGDNYYTLYAHAEEIFKKKNEAVESGEVIATVGDTDALTGPGLHFEVRHHGTPEDPVKWLKTG